MACSTSFEKFSIGFDIREGERERGRGIRVGDESNKIGKNVIAS